MVKVAFGDEIEAVQKEAKSLREQGVQIIIALGHSGYDIDQVGLNALKRTKQCSILFKVKKVRALVQLLNAGTFTFLVTRNWQDLCLSWTWLLVDTRTPSCTREPFSILIRVIIHLRCSFSPFFGW